VIKILYQQMFLFAIYLKCSVIFDIIMH